MSHYFENDNNLISEIRTFDININNVNFSFNTDNGVFSKGELDYGTYLLLKNVVKRDLHGKILDLGCGYGPIGIIIKKLFSSLTQSCIVITFLFKALISATSK